MSLPLIPSFRRQQRLIDFASLEQTCPDGIYLSPSADDPSVWQGVFFVRSGPYESAVLRFDLSFPSAYPDAPPLITFSTDIFHPLVVPLTTYTFSTGVLDSTGTVSASDQDRLPPGSVSLRHGFPHWYNRSSSLRSSLASDKNRQDHNELEHNHTSLGSIQALEQDAQDSRITCLKVLEHLKMIFEKEDSLDNISLETAGNPSAWHAWQAYRGLAHNPRGRSSISDERSQASPQHPGDWNWDGVWESRVNDGIEASVNEATLFTAAGPIRFSKLELGQLSEIRETLRQT